MQAILTRYLPATNTRGDRIKATCEAGSITIDFLYGDVDQHALAVQMLLKKLGWNCAFVSGVLPDGNKCHVLTHIK